MVAPPPRRIKVRTVTTGVRLASGVGVDEWARVLGGVHGFNVAARAAYEAAGYEVQTVRLATNPFEEYVDCADRDAAVATFARLDGVLAALGADALAAGPATTAAGRAVIAAVLAASPRISFSARVAGPADVAGCRAIARVVGEIARATPGGAGNFRFCAACNVGPGSPFFPAAFHGESGPSFAVGCEFPGVVADAVAASGGDVARAGPALTAALERELRPVDAVARALAAGPGGVPYRGVDASACPAVGAPSLADAVGALAAGGGGFGAAGTLAACACVTGALKAVSGVALCGYTGLMLPPLEDAGLARAVDAGAAERRVMARRGPWRW